MAMTLRVTVARSARTERKLWTGKPSSVQRLRALHWAASGALRLGDDGGPCGVGRGLAVIVEQNRFELLAHVPFDVIGQHA